MKRSDHAEALRIPELDTLRGIAAVAVYVFHVQLIAGFDKRVLPPLQVGARTISLPNVLSLGAMGVSLFFVLSGYCLARGPLHRQVAVPIGAYYRSRFARLYPAYFASLLLSAALVSYSWSDWTPRALLEQFVAHALFLHSLSGRWIIAFNGPLWSMATEVQFYLGFPWLLAALRRRGAALFLLLTFAVTLVYRVVASTYREHVPDGSSVSLEALLAMQLPGRLAEFALGMALAAAMPSLARWSPRRWLGFAALSAAVALPLRMRGPGALVESAFGLMFTAGLGWVLARRACGQASRGWWASAAAHFGRSSYSFFLVHLPVSAAVIAVQPITPSAPYARLAWYVAVTFVPCALVAEAFKRWIEDPLGAVLSQRARGRTSELAAAPLPPGAL